MTTTEREKALLNELNEVKRRTGLRSWEIYRDWVEAMAVALANATDTNHTVRTEREERYTKLVERLGRENMTRLKTAYAHLIELFELERKDWLGHLYMTLELGNPDSGQYFSPPDVSALTARLALDPETARAAIQQRGYVTLQEPTAGAGGMIIEFTKQFQAAGFNPQRQLHVTAVDIDITAVHMTYVQLSLLGVPAIVIHGDIIRLAEWSHWRTPFHTIGLWEYRLKRPPQTEPAEPTGSQATIQGTLFPRKEEQAA